LSRSGSVRPHDELPWDEYSPRGVVILVIDDDDHRRPPPPVAEEASALTTRMTTMITTREVDVGRRHSMGSMIEEMERGRCRPR
jgi:hypothetical protein